MSLVGNFSTLREKQKKWIRLTFRASLSLSLSLSLSFSLSLFSLSLSALSSLPRARPRIADLSCLPKGKSADTSVVVRYEEKQKIQNKLSLS
jgi:hypothetical protein